MTLVNHRTFLAGIGAIFSLVLTAGELHAHGLPAKTKQVFHPGLSLQASFQASYRNQSLVENEQRWLLPGRLLGGEALPLQRGFSVDEAFLTAIYATDQAYAVAKLGQHSSEHGLALEHVYVGTFLTENINVDIGKLNGEFSPFNTIHSSQMRSASPLLLYDSFFGRQFNDDGLRLKSSWFDGALIVGGEAWRGSHFPANDSESTDLAWDLFAHLYVSAEALELRGGAYTFKAEADRRIDDRYDATHSHGVNTSNIPNLYFTGDIEVVGVHGLLSANLFDDLWLGAQGEWASYKSEGSLRDELRLAAYRASHKAMWVELFAVAGVHQVSVRYETLKLKNELWGLAAATLVELAQLDSAGKDPYRQSVGYGFQWKPELLLRLEWERHLLTGHQQDLTTASMVWQFETQAK